MRRRRWLQRGCAAREPFSCYCMVQFEDILAISVHLLAEVRGIRTELSEIPSVWSEGNRAVSIAGN